MKLNTKQTNIMYVVLGFAMVAFVLTFFPDTGITGHVSVEAGYQPLDMVIKESQSYVMTTDYENPITITFIRLSGEVIGDGRAEVILDNGLGQRLLIYSNAEEELGVNKITGMQYNKITGMAISEEMKELSLLNLVEKGTLPDISPEPPAGTLLYEGSFANKCRQTCLMEMELSKEANYILEVMVSEGTELKLDNMIYGILLE